MEPEIIDNERVWSIKYFILPFALLMNLLAYSIFTADISSWMFSLIALLSLIYIAYYAFYSAAVKMENNHLLFNRLTQWVKIPVEDITSISQYGILEDHNYMVVKITFRHKTPLGSWVLIHLKKGTSDVDDTFADEVDYLKSLFNVKKAVH